MDCDFYAAVDEVLTALYPRLSDGGYVVFDDWKFASAAHAILDFRARHNITAPLWTTAFVGYRAGPARRTRARWLLRMQMLPYFKSIDPIVFWRKGAVAANHEQGMSQLIA